MMIIWSSRFKNDDASINWKGEGIFDDAYRVNSLDSIESVAFPTGLQPKSDEYTPNSSISFSFFPRASGGEKENRQVSFKYIYIDGKESSPTGGYYTKFLFIFPSYLHVFFFQAFGSLDFDLYIIKRRGRLSVWFYFQNRGTPSWTASGRPAGWAGVSAIPITTCASSSARRISKSEEAECIQPEFQSDRFDWKEADRFRRAMRHLHVYRVTRVKYNSRVIKREKVHGVPRVLQIVKLMHNDVCKLLSCR